MAGPRPTPALERMQHYKVLANRAREMVLDDVRVARERPEDEGMPMAEPEEYEEGEPTT